MIDVIYFASIRERLGREREQIAFEPGDTLDRIRQRLMEQGSPWHEVLGGGALLAARNKQMAPLDTAVEDGDEIAFFPPVTGG